MPALPDPRILNLCDLKEATAGILCHAEPRWAFNDSQRSAHHVYHRLPRCSCAGEFMLTVLHCPLPRETRVAVWDRVGFVVDPLWQVTPATPVEVVLHKDRNTSLENPGVGLVCHLIQKSRLQSL